MLIIMEQPNNNNQRNIFDPRNGAGADNNPRLIPIIAQEINHNPQFIPIVAQEINYANRVRNHIVIPEPRADNDYDSGYESS